MSVVRLRKDDLGYCEKRTYRIRENPCEKAAKDHIQKGNCEEVGYVVAWRNQSTS